MNKMAEEILIDNATNQRIANKNGTTRFLCPGCQKFEIVRSGHSREIAAKYTCAQCGFRGPN